MTTPVSTNNTTPAFVRTGTPMGAGAVIVWAARQFFGLEITVDQALLLMPAVMFVYYALGRALEEYNPKLGYVLGVAKKPAYSPEPAPSPNKDEEVVAEVVPDVKAEEVVEGDVEEPPLPPEPEPLLPAELPTPVKKAVKRPVKKAQTAQPLPEKRPARTQQVRSVPISEARKVAKKIPPAKAPRKKP